ncbi:MAG: hypothetical protein ACI93T_000109 [Porticoccaceae bacterium]|jgi:hypothetical protein
MQFSIQVWQALESEFDAHRLLILKSRQNRSRPRGFCGVDALAAVTDAYFRPYLLRALTDGISL